MLYGGDGPGPLLTAAPASGWKMKATDRNNCLSWLIILYVGIADNCTFIFTTKYTDTLSIMQRKFLILFMKFAKRGDLIHCTPDKTQKQSAGAERNFSGDSPWVINDKSSSQAQGPSWCGYHFYCSVSYLCFKCFVSEEQTCCKQSPSLVSLIKYNQLFPQWTKMQSRIMKKRKVFSAIFICYNDIVNISWTKQ